MIVCVERDRELASAAWEKLREASLVWTPQQQQPAIVPILRFNKRFKVTMSDWKEAVARFQKSELFDPPSLANKFTFLQCRLLDCRLLDAPDRDPETDRPSVWRCRMLAIIVFFPSD